MCHEPADHRGRLFRLALLVGSILLLSLGAPAQNFDNVPRHFFNQRHFEIPFKMNPGRRVTQVRLHASTDGKVFQLVASASPTDRQAFDFTAQKDGWHYFVVQVEDDRKNLIPANVDSTVVDLQVCVDTEKPVIEKFLEVIPNPKEGSVGVEWSVKDNQQLNLQRLRVEYQKAGEKGKWTAVPVKPMNPAQVGWFPPEAGKYAVRLTAADVAGNTATQEIEVTAKTGGQPSPVPAESAPDVHHVPKKTFKLQYKIADVGPSGVKNVEIWMTQDTRLWSKFRDDAPTDPKGGYEMTVPTAGRYGFTVRPISGVMKATPPPSVHEQPQVWIQVDETKPVVQIVGVTPGEGDKEGTITVKWVAKDKWLQEKPITIKYAASPEARDEDWKPLASQLANSGTHEVPKEAIATNNLPYQFYLRVEAADRAGNVGRDQTRDTVKVDTKAPRAMDVKVIPVAVDVNVKKDP